MAERTRPTAAQRGYGSKWQKARAGFLRKHPLCRACDGAGKLVTATVVDHVAPHRGDFALFWDSANWQPLCKPCHDAKTAAESGIGALPLQRSAVPCTLVAGPPGAGKTTLVRKSMRRGDLVLDLDAVLTALSAGAPYDRPHALLPFGLECRSAVLQRLARPSEVTHAWLIEGAPRAAQRERYRDALGARIVVLETGPSACLRRIRADAARAKRWQTWEPIVADWWERYERIPTDTVHKG